MTDLGDFSEFGGDREGSAKENAGNGASSASESGTGDAGGATAATSVDGSGESERTFDRVDVEPSGVDRGIGTLAASRGLKIHEESEESTLRTYVTAQNRSGIRIGSYLLVPYPDGEQLFCRVAGLEYAREFQGDDATEIHARRAMRRSGIEETDYKFLADLDPVAVLYSEAGELRRRMADRLPKPDSVVREVSDPEEIKTGLNIPEEGVFLGHLSVGGEKVRTAAEPPTIDYRLKDDDEAGDPLIFRHMLVAGGTGSGKTHCAKNVLRQYLDRTYEMADGRRPEVAVVQFDPQDEYAQMGEDNEAMTENDRRSFERQGIAHDGHDDVRAFVPRVSGASYGAEYHRAEQIEFTIPFSMVRENRWLVAGGQLNDNQYNALYELLDRFFRQYGDDGTYREFRSFLDPALREELDEAGLVHEATFDAVKRRVQGFGHVFDRDAPAITDLVHELVRPGRLSAVPTYHVNDSRATEVIVLAVASLLVDQKLSNDPEHERIKETPLIVGMDEAHNFLTDAESVQARRVIGKFTEAAKQGRKERLGLFLVTQDPQDIADPVFKQVNTKVVLNLVDEDAISAVNIPATLQGKVPYMEKGQCVIHSPDNSEPVELIGLSTCVTRHGRE